MSDCEPITVIEGLKIPTRVFRYVWKEYDWKKIENYEHAYVRQLDSNAGGDKPGKQFQLRIPRIDPDTGTYMDVDGRLSADSVLMCGSDISYWDANRQTFRGFVNESYIDGEEIDSDSFNLERWVVTLRHEPGNES